MWLPAIPAILRITAVLCDAFPFTVRPNTTHNYTMWRAFSQSLSTGEITSNTGSETG